MLKKVIDFFSGRSASLNVTADGEAAAEDLKSAAAVILLEMAGTDDDYAPEETDAIFDVLRTHFKVTEEEALNILELADALRQNREKVDEFVEIIKASFDVRQRQRLYAAAWKVVLADGRVDSSESRFAVELKFRLQLTDDQVERARKMAERGEI